MELLRQKNKKTVGPLTPAEKQKNYRLRHSEKIKEKDRGRQKGQRSHLKEDEKLWNDYRKKENERMRLRRALLKEKSQNNIDLSKNENTYKCPQSLGKAVRKVQNALPTSPRKRQKVLQTVLNNANSTSTSTELQRSRQSLPITTEEAVINFYSSNDASWQAPGMKDHVIERLEDGTKNYLQKRFMLFSLKEAHQLFLEANPEKLISLSKFCSLRPLNVVTFSNVPHNVCVCTEHENIPLLLVVLNNVDKNIPTEFRTFINTIVCDPQNFNCMQQECATCHNRINLLKPTSNECLTYFRWSKNDLKKVDKLKFTATVHEIFQILASKLRSFLIHTFIKRTQSKKFDNLKCNVDVKSILIPVDFSENFSIKDQNEIQSAHWVNNQCTLFTVFMWINGTITKSMVIISDYLEHEKYAVYTFMTHIFKYLKSNFPDVLHVNIFSDGPSSQFKQKYLFSNLEVWSEKYSFNIFWHFLATSHGKGVVDGIGGSVKRSVWRRVLCGEVSKSAEDVADLAKKVNPNVIISYITKDTIEQTKTTLDERWRLISTIPGTHNIHFITSGKNGIVKYSNTSATLNLQETQIHHSDSNDKNITDNSDKEINMHDWVVVLYEEEYFPGEITNIIGDDIEVDAMEQCGDVWNWPKISEIYYDREKVIRKISPPTIEMKGSRIFYSFHDIQEL
ncbi:hypothetical protein LOTGIDRAFT_164827 [Lottia gigantea]|uniref:Uncharacterized protein n=1 Tax=Lottia gigantea TaxID=225164 RepID=V4BLV0_LOTGI|nr:hypothetical protein LOTGIDRAFT_164827 [Lottia gigantea]ESO89794.1 hypothetical protein LOTGIDRAFT_164827 [Lottia gigantea]